MDFNQQQAVEMKRLLVDGVANMSVDLSEQQIEQLLAYVELIAKWNKVYNLTAVRDRVEMVSQHLLDSLAVIPLLRGERMLDVGSGAGLPGIVLAIVRPEVQVVSIDKVHKKIAFQTQAVAELGLSNFRPLSARVEELQEAPFDTIVSRAFASLADFVQLTRPLLAPNGEWAAMKGVYPQQEIEQLPPDITATHVLAVQVPGLDAERHLVRMKPLEL